MLFLIFHFTAVYMSVSWGNVIRVFGIHLAKAKTQFCNLILSLCSHAMGTLKKTTFSTLIAQEGKHNDYVIEFVGLMADLGYDMQ